MGDEMSERDEARARAEAAAARIAELEEWLATERDRAERAERSAVAWEADALLRERNRADQQARAERAEAALAEVREAALAVDADAQNDEAWIALGVALADTAQAAEAYTRRVRAGVLKAAADRIDAGKCRECAALVRAMADERGGR